MSSVPVTVRVIGAGRAGRSFAKAIDDLDGWDVLEMAGRGVPIASGAADVDLVLIATPEAAIDDVAKPSTSSTSIVFSGQNTRSRSAPRSVGMPLVAAR